jgi:Sulfotransferase family
VHRFVVNEAFIDLHRSHARGLYLASWQRSGSTWLAQIVASMPGTRLVYEPANVRQRLFTDGQPRLTSLPLSGPGSELGEDGIMLANALDGSLRSPWMDRMNRTRRATRRVVKDVRTIAVLPWIVDSFPDVPMVLLLRHPMAVAHSIIDLGWVRDPEGQLAGGLQSDDPDIRHAARQRILIDEVSLWSAHHGWAMSHPATARVHVVFYEDLVNQPTAELERLRRYLAGFHPVWSTWIPRPDASRRPSATSFRRKTGTPSEWIDTWSGAYDAVTLEQVQRIIDAERLGGLYAISPMPLVPGESAIDTVQGSRGPPVQS